jgi:hypothetical protein
MFQTKTVEKIKIHILCSVSFSPPPENHAVYEKMSKNMMELEASEHMALACGTYGSS